MNISVSCRSTLTMLFLTAICAALGAADVKAIGGEKLFSFGILESGSWAEGGNLVNRLDLRLYAPWSLQLRWQFTDRRPTPPWEYPDEGISAVGAALYHKSTGSRLI